MLFNSIEFAIFLPIVFVIHWGLCRQSESKNALLLLASYFFYGCWDWRFTFLLFFSTALDFYTGIKIHNSDSRRSRLTWLWISIAINLGFLGLFKYYNFFVDNLESMGVVGNFPTLKIILPVGISFYTFHGLSYVIDIYYRRIEPERNFGTYALFVSFFPLLVAGPIERATHLLPQLKKNRVFSYEDGVSGLRQILWGLFKKVVVADSCAIIVDDIFEHSTSYGGSTLLLGSILFAFQIYCDFSGYSDIALGTARLFGIELLRNFAYPYFSRDIAEFWRRWHISLTSWFKDYVYIPLGGSHGGTWKRIRNVTIIFLLSGFWHGANWTFIVWGLLNAIYIAPSIILRNNRSNINIIGSDGKVPSLKEITHVFLTFSLSVLAWIFFRATSVSQAIDIIGDIFSPTVSNRIPLTTFHIATLIITATMMYVEWRGRMLPYALADGLFRNRHLRTALYLVLSIFILVYYGTNQTFIYFQF